MREYTPTTEDVRGWYYEGRHYFYPQIIEIHDEFNRWLAAHDAEVYQRGREDAAEAVAAIGPIGGCSHDAGGTCLCEIERTYAIAVAGGYDTE